MQAVAHGALQRKIHGVAKGFALSRKTPAYGALQKKVGSIVNFCFMCADRCAICIAAKNMAWRKKQIGSSVSTKVLERRSKLTAANVFKIVFLSYPAASG